jgi:hypothetical protein
LDETTNLSLKVKSMKLIPIIEYSDEDEEYEELGQ